MSRQIGQAADRKSPRGWIATVQTEVQEVLMRLAAAGLVPARIFLPSVPEPKDLPGHTGHLQLEIVSHSWRYHPLLAYQLSSLVNYPPSRVSVTMTVFYSPEDEGTAGTLDFFGRIAVPGVAWNWMPIEKERLFRRAIGRNLAARKTAADWIWFTDCDVVFHRGSLDALADALQGRRDRLVFPRTENCTSLLPPDDPLLTAAAEHPKVVDIDTARFTPREMEVAKGPMQIVHGDVARAVGYCEVIGVYQQPADRWRKAWEDRAFRWLLRTGGTAIDVPGIYRIRHASKGRYVERSLTGRVRGAIRRMESWMRERRISRKSNR